MLRFIISFGLVLFLIGCRSASTMETYTYLALGDSYTIGESVPDEYSFPYQITNRLQANGLGMEKPVIIARTGWTTDELQAGIRREILTPPYDIVTLLIGVNNQYRGRDMDNYDIEFKELLQQAIKLSGGDPGKVIVISIPDWGVTPFATNRDREAIGQQIDEFNRINYTRALEEGVHYVDVTQISKKAAEDSTLLAEDGLHPSAKMYGLWTDKLAPLAMAILTSKK